MAGLGLLFILTVPYFIGTMETWLLREKNAGMLNAYLTGFLSLFAVLGASVLASLRLDLDLTGLTRIFIITVVALTMISLPFYVIKTRQEISEKFTGIRSPKGMFFLVVFALLLGYLAYVAFVPEYANEDIFEVVETTITEGSLYEVSAFTGKDMEAGLPIFSKIYVPAMFYSIFVSGFGIPMWFLGGILFPAVIFILSLLLMHKIGKGRIDFSIFYLIVLLAGLYLPSNGLPVTTGFALLREGYSGYAITYGLIIPFFVYLLLEKRYVHAVFTLIPALFLVRLDRVYFTIKDPVTFFTSVNTAGKLAIVYIVAVIVYISLRFKKKEKLLSPIFFSPTITILTVVSEVSDLFWERHKKAIWYMGTGLLVLFAANSIVFSDAKVSKSLTKTDDNVEACLDVLETLPGNPCIYAPSAVMEGARRGHGTIKTLYSRRSYEKMLDGIDYEPGLQYMDDYLYFMKNLAEGNDHMPVKHTTKQMLLMAQNDGMDTFVVPVGSITAELSEGLSYIDMEKRFEAGGYAVFR